MQAARKWMRIEAEEARLGDYAEIGGSWWRIVEFFPGVGDQVRGESKGRETTAMVQSVVRWRRKRPELMRMEG
jgi:hypothetical protein